MVTVMGINLFFTYSVFVCFFFFQAEDGIRDVAVTGVQTCALPISIGGIFGSLAGAVEGDPGIRPERQTEIEGGMDATLLRGRLTANVTVFNKTITDLLLVQTLAPSTGRTQRVFNGGKMRNRGVEVGLGYALAQTPEVSWIVRSTFFANRSKVLDL